MLHSPSQKQVGLGARWVNVGNRFGKKNLHFSLVNLFSHFGAEQVLVVKNLEYDNNDNN